MVEMYKMACNVGACNFTISLFFLQFYKEYVAAEVLQDKPFYVTSYYSFHFFFRAKISYGLLYGV